MLQQIKRHVPESIKKPVRRVLTALMKPELPYLELHLTDHCNLDCKGCGHFSPLAAPNFASIEQYRLDLSRLSQLFSNIRIIRLMGGEPLLHPEVIDFIAMTYRFFPHANIRFVTNGLLLTSVTDMFWIKCVETGTTIDLTLYPPLRPRAEQLRSLCRSKGVPLNTTEVEHFVSIMNPSGSSDQASSYKTCQSKSIALPFLSNGRLYQCAEPALIHYFNDWFNYDIPADPGIDIHASFLSGHKILQRLDNSITNCKYCRFDSVPFPWSISRKKLAEWDVAAQITAHEIETCPENRRKYEKEY